MAKYRNQEYSNVMLFGTASVDGDDNMVLTDVGKRRCDRAAEAYYSDETIKMLISGGYSKLLFESPPEETEAQLFADYLVKEYRIPAKALLLEEESTTTEENFKRSIAQHPEFFEGIKAGAEKLGLVSQANHLGRVSEIGRKALGFEETEDSNFVDLVACQPVERASKIQVIGAGVVERVVAAAD